MLKPNTNKTKSKPRSSLASVSVMLSLVNFNSNSRPIYSLPSAIHGVTLFTANSKRRKTQITLQCSICNGIYIFFLLWCYRSRGSGRGQSATVSNSLDPRKKATLFVSHLQRAVHGHSFFFCMSHTQNGQTVR